MATTVCAHPCHFEVGTDGKLALNLKGDGTWPYDCDPAANGGGIYCDADSGGLFADPRGLTRIGTNRAATDAEINRPIPNNPAIIPELTQTLVMNNTSCYDAEGLFFAGAQVTLEGNSNAFGNWSIEFSTDDPPGSPNMLPGDDMLSWRNGAGAGAQGRMGPQLTRFIPVAVPAGQSVPITTNVWTVDRNPGVGDLRLQFANLVTRFFIVAV